MIDTTEFKESIDELNVFAENLYNANFEMYLSDIRELQNRMQSKLRPITDQELEDILTVLPLNLFSASEALNRLRLEQEVIKLNNKKRKVKILKEISEKSSISKTDIVASELADSEMIIAVYATVISRVESEMSYCKELIMGCKKIWDGRRSSEKSNPISEIDLDTLPEYQKDVYIK